MNPKISICLPTYNRAMSLKETLNRLLIQTYQDYEIIIGNDASEDNTREIIRSFKDDRIKYHEHKRNIGIYPNWNYLVHLAKGEYVSIYHDHDIYLPNILKRSVDILERNRNIVFIHSAFVLINKDRNPLNVFVEEFAEITPGMEFKKYFLMSSKNTICAATVMARRDAYEKVGKFNTIYGLGCDKEMWFRLASLGDVGYINEPQALILGRSKGDATEKFVMDDFRGSYNLLHEGLKSLYPIKSRQYRQGLIKLRWEYESGVLRHIFKAIACEDLPNIKNRVEAFSGYCKPITKALMKAFVNCRIIRFIIEKAARHYHSKQLIKRQLNAALYCRRSKELYKYIVWPHVDSFRR